MKKISNYSASNQRIGNSIDKLDLFDQISNWLTQKKNSIYYKRIKSKNFKTVITSINITIIKNKKKLI